jgi:hypothetical protein
MIGIIGGYGDVGLQAARMFNEWGKHPLRIGGRNPETARLKLEAEFPRAQWVSVNIEDDRSMESFLDGCELIVNCAGPSYRTAACAAGMCLAKGCHHVDAGFDKGLEAMIGTPQSTAVLYAAGATPGLSGLLPRWLAKSFDKVDSLIYFAGALDRFTASAAEDYLAGVSGNDNEPLAAWKDGARRSSVLRRKPGATLPFFPREVALYPYFDAEAEFVAASLSLRDGEWYLAIDGSHVPPVLEEVRTLFPADRKSAVKRLCMAAELDSAGRRKYINLIIQLRGIQNGAGITRTLILQADRPSTLTGWAVAAAGIALLEGDIPPGVGPLAAIPDPDKVIARLRNVKCITQWKVLECSIDELLRPAEGEI